jgi:hypothetical protein
MCFSPYPPDVPPNPCVQPEGPRLHWRDDANLATVLEVTNPNPAPMNLLIEGATSDLALDAAQVYPGSPASETLNWSPVFAGALSPQQTVVIDLDDDVVGGGPRAASGPAAILLRYSTNVEGVEQRAMYHLEVSAIPISVESGTWGRVKALYGD